MRPAASGSWHPAFHSMVDCIQSTVSQRKIASLSCCCQAFCHSSDESNWNTAKSSLHLYLQQPQTLLFPLLLYSSLIAMGIPERNWNKVWCDILCREIYVQNISIGAEFHGTFRLLCKLNLKKNLLRLILHIVRTVFFSFVFNTNRFKALIVSNS